MSRFPGMLREMVEHLDNQNSDQDNVANGALDDEKIVGLISATLKRSVDRAAVGGYVTIREECLEEVGEIFRRQLPGDDDRHSFGRALCACVYLCLVCAASALEAAIENVVQNLELERSTASSALLYLLHVHSVQEKKEVFFRRTSCPPSPRLSRTG